MNPTTYYIITQSSLVAKGIFKSDTSVILQHTPEAGKVPKAEDLYPGFDPSILKMVHSNDKELPEYFKLDRKGKIVGLSAAEMEKAGLGPTVIPQMVLPMGVFEEMRNGEIVIKMPEEVVAQAGSLTESECAEVMGSLTRRLEKEIAEKYPPGYEMKLTKAYLAWLNDDKPEGDSRETAYQDMETYIAQVKAKYKPLTSPIKKRMEALQQKKVKKTDSLPDKTATKAELQKYLKKKKIAFATKETKLQLLAKIK